MDAIAPEGLRQQVALIRRHAGEGTVHTREAARDGAPAWDRFENGVRAMDNFEHGIADARGVPVAGELLNTIYRRYIIAKRIAEVALGTGFVPAPQERYGRAELLESRDHFRSARAELDRGKETNWTIAKDLLSHSIDDGMTGAAILHEVRKGAELAARLGAVRTAAVGRKHPGEDFLNNVDKLYDGLLTGANDAIAAADAADAAARR